MIHTKKGKKDSNLNGKVPLNRVLFTHRIRKKKDFTQGDINKKGAITDIFVWIVLGFIMILFLGAIIYAFNQVNLEILVATKDIDAGGDFNNTNFTASAEDTVGKFNVGLSVFRWSIGAFILALGISIFISNFLVRIHPVFIIPYILIVVLAIIFSVFISNAYEERIITDTTIGTTVTSFAGANFIFLNLPVWVTIMGLLGGMMMFLGINRDRDLGGGLT